MAPDAGAIAAFDVVANNADRKSGHVLVAEDRLWAIDHGLTFHTEPKLRTVIWDFAGEPLAAGLLADLRPPAGRRCRTDLAGLLDADEVAATVAGEPGSSRPAPCPSPTATGTGPPTPGPWSERPRSPRGPGRPGTRCSGDRGARGYSGCAAGRAWPR